jgi:hypothetical protein
MGSEYKQRLNSNQAKRGKKEMAPKKKRKLYNGEWHTVVKLDSAKGKYLMRPDSGAEEIWVDASEFSPSSGSAPGGGKRLPRRRRGQPPR